MPTKLILLWLLSSPVAALAALDAALPEHSNHDPMMGQQPMSPKADAFEHPDGHGGSIYHAVSLELDSGASSASNQTVSSWDLSGWIGGDTNKLWIKSEGELENSSTKQAVKHDVLTMCNSTLCL